MECTNKFYCRVRNIKFNKNQFGHSRFVTRGERERLTEMAKAVDGTDEVKHDIRSANRCNPTFNSTKSAD